MRDKVDEFAATGSLLSSDGLSSPGLAHSFKNEAIEALQALGYKPLDAEKMVKKVEQTGSAIDSASSLIRKALQASVQRS